MITFIFGDFPIAVARTTDGISTDHGDPQTSAFYGREKLQRFGHTMDTLVCFEYIWHLYSLSFPVCLPILVALQLLSGKHGEWHRKKPPISINSSSTRTWVSLVLDFLQASPINWVLYWYCLLYLHWLIVESHSRSWVHHRWTCYSIRIECILFCSGRTYKFKG